MHPKEVSDGRKQPRSSDRTYVYVLRSFLRRDMVRHRDHRICRTKDRGRVKLGPGTLYTLLGKFQDEKLIQETEVDGRKRTYRITPKGRAVYQEEVDRLRSCLMDAEEEGIL